MSGRYAEVMRELGTEDGEFFARHYDVTPAGNFEGHNILNRLKPHANAAKPMKRGLPVCAQNSSPCARRGCVPASTTKCSPTGTA